MNPQTRPNLFSERGDASESRRTVFSIREETETQHQRSSGIKFGRVYLDHNATSPPSLEHLRKLFEKLSVCSGNPSSPHAVGRAASVSLTKARHSVAKALGVGVGEIIFVSGGTEANNLGTAGVLRYHNKNLSEQHAIISAIEHPAVFAHLQYLQETENLNLTIVPVDQNGFVSASDVISAITEKTTLVSIMAVNNEVGSIQPVKEIGDYLHHKRWSESSPQSLFFQKLHFHVDAVQAFGKLRPEHWLTLGVDSCALSAHKLGALQGTGALFLRQGRKFKPAIMGGAQEKNRRAGTENLAGIVSFGQICEESVLQPDWWERVERMDAQRIRLYQAIKKLPSVVMNSPLTGVISNTVHFSICGKSLKGEDLLLMLDMNGICASSGSACSSGANLPSKVLLAMGRTSDLAQNAIRMSLAVNTTDEEMEYTIGVLKKSFN